jgi:hypothetical protein
MSIDQDKLTIDQQLIETCISVVGSAKRLSDITGYRQETISRFRNGKKEMSLPAHKLFHLAIEVGELKQENAQLKRKNFFANNANKNKLKG